MDVTTLRDDGELASHLAHGAGQLLLAVRAELADAPPDVRKAEGDRRSHEWLLDGLRAHRPSDVVLSEEGSDDPARLSADRVWIVDPLDGTREFSELDRRDWAVHVALWEGGDITAAAVALPGQGAVLSTSDPAVAVDADDGPLRLLVSRTRPPSWTADLAESLGAALVPMGSAGAKAMAVVQGSADVYVHAGGQYEWDSAAPVGVARAAGLHTSRVDGSPLRYNQPDPLLPDVLVCRRSCAQEVLQALSTLSLG